MTAASRETRRLEAELKMQKAVDKLEELRDAMHADRGDRAKVQAYRKQGEIVHAARREYREKHRVKSSNPNDATPTPDTVEAKGKPEPVEAG